LSALGTAPQLIPYYHRHFSISPHQKPTSDIPATEGITFTGD